MLSYFLVLLLSLPGRWLVPDGLFHHSPSFGRQIESRIYPAHLDSALAYVGVTESGGKNSGPEIDRFLASVGLDPGYAWCAAFVSYSLEISDPMPEFPQVRSALARHFRVSGYAIDIRRAVASSMEYEPGWIIGWQRGTSIYGHVGFVIHGSGPRMRTVEGNTSPGTGGSQFDGGGVHVRRREYVASNYLRIDWILPVKYE